MSRSLDTDTNHVGDATIIVQQDTPSSWDELRRGVDQLADVAIAAIRASGEVEFRVEYAVQHRTFIGGDWDRIDDGTLWSHRSGKKYTASEARAEIEDSDRSRLVTRHITEWTAE